MATYWLTFRIADQGNYSERYDALHHAVFEAAEGGKWWTESTSFYVFESPLKAQEVAEKIESVINPQTDLALLGMPGFKVAKAIGAVEDEDLFTLIPFAKRA